MTEVGERFHFIKTILVNKQHLLISCIQKRTDPLRVSISLIKTMVFNFGVFSFKQSNKGSSNSTKNSRF